MSERCLHCSFSPTSYSDFCSEHKPVTHQQQEADRKLIKEAIRYGQFSNDILRVHGLSQSIREALFRHFKESVK